MRNQEISIHFNLALERIQKIRKLICASSVFQRRYQFMSLAEFKQTVEKQFPRNSFCSFQFILIKACLFRQMCYLFMHMWCENATLGKSLKLHDFRIDFFSSLTLSRNISERIGFIYFIEQLYTCTKCKHRHYYTVRKKCTYLLNHIQFFKDL